MQSRKELKKNAKSVLKSNYLSIILTCLTVMIIIGNFVNPITTIEEAKNKYFSELNNTALFAESDTDFTPADNIKQDVLDEDEIVNDFMEHTGADDEKAQKWTNGVLAIIANNTEGADNLLYGILNSVNQLVFHNKIQSGIIIFIGVIIYFLISVFFVNVIRVGYSRYLLETRRYTKTKLSRIMFVWSIKKEIHIGCVMLVKKIYSFLWWLTIIGGIIKSYSYRLVPMILAENPTLSAKEAITLSRDMMRGYKWKTFILDVSFLGWKILSIFTFYILDIFFLTPYVYLTDTELYMALRKTAKENNIKNADKLCDSFLDEPVSQTAYPVESFIVPTLRTRRWIESDNLNRTYSISSLILIFFTFSIIGWLWEVSLHLFTTGVFVNRGTSYGPWLPIYGVGGVLVLIALKKFRDKPALTFLFSMVLCGIVEYFTSWFLETTANGMKWWDYSGYFLNINGRVCLEGLLVFALGGCLSIYLIAPALDNLFMRIPPHTKKTICTVLISVFLCDQCYSQLINRNSGEGITDYL